MDQVRFVARQIGQRIRAARSARKMTLKELGEKSDLSAAFLSRIERGEAATSIANLIAIATCVDIPLRDLFEDTSNSAAAKGYTLFRKAERLSGQLLEANGYQYHGLSATFPDPSLSTFVLEFPVTSDTSVNLLSHEGEEVLYILEGRIEFQIGQDSFVLEAGDCVHLKGERPHMGRNVGTGLARMLMVVTPSHVVDHQG
ncbi:helix-turn-helix domain-containing protein [Xanthobacteraceae bacterium A53D]